MKKIKLFFIVIMFSFSTALFAANVTETLKVKGLT
jgi:hypothetical protein